MSAERTKTAFMNEIRAHYPWLDEAHVEYWAQKCIINQNKGQK